MKIDYLNLFVLLLTSLCDYCAIIPQCSHEDEAMNDSIRNPNDQQLLITT